MTAKERKREIMAADFLVGERVIDEQGEDLGRVEDIMIDTATGRVRYAVLSFGGVFGLGEKLYALPWRSLLPDPENRQFILSIDRDRLKEAPGFDRYDWPRMADRQWGLEIHRFYDQTPYWENLERGGMLGGDLPEPPHPPQRE